jgi:preprotein translocase subunit SecA
MSTNLKSKEAKDQITASVKSQSATNFSDQTKQTTNRNFISRFFSKVEGEQKELKRYTHIVQEVEEFDAQMQKMTDKQLQAQTVKFRVALQGITDEKQLERKLKEILPEAFATVREAAFRVIGQKHYPVQLIGGAVLHEGRVSEMRTGEGKTLVSTLVGYLNALPDQNQVHLVTVNDYLARRDASWMGQIYDFLGLTIGVIQNQASFYFKLGAEADEASEHKRAIGQVDSLEDGEMDGKTVLDVKNLVACSRERAYTSEDGVKLDVVYGVNSEFGFDYLRDNMAQTPDEIVQKTGHTVAIVDEVDSILIDEARTPLIISAQDEDSSSRYKQFSKLVQKINPDLDCTVDEKRKTVILNELGVEKVEALLGVKSLYETSENVVLVHHLDQALKAEFLFKREKEYVVRDGEIVIVDENTGRMMFGRRFNQGLHQAIEAKEGQNVQAESKTTATITFQNYFRLYKKLAGMTGTAATEAEELFKIYKLLVVTIPTHRNTQRDDYVDKIYKNEMGKFAAIVRDIKDLNQKGQPVLVGTTSIEKNMLLSSLLTQSGVPHQVLNAKNHEQEARIVTDAGKFGAVTIATNIAGRGVDIKLGGEMPEDTKAISKWKEEHEKIKALGGLFVIGTERHESRRIDNQLRGRAGRQGDPGKSQFYISLEDYIIRVFGGDKIEYYKNILPIADDEAIQNSSISWLIEQAQKKIEGQNFDIRKHVTDYDDVISKQRTVVYSRRQKVLMNDGFDAKVELEKSLTRDVFKIVSSLPKAANKDKISAFALHNVSQSLKTIVNIPDFDEEVLTILFLDNKFNYPKIASFISEKVNYQLKTKWEIYQDDAQLGMSRFAFLRAIDILWTEHLVTIDHLQDSVRLRGYSQKDPLVEFKHDGMKSFTGLLEEIDSEVAKTVFKITPELVPAGIMSGKGIKK